MEYLDMLEEYKREIVDTIKTSSDITEDEKIEYLLSVGYCVEAIKKHHMEIDNLNHTLDAIVYNIYGTIEEVTEE